MKRIFRKATPQEYDQTSGADTVHFVYDSWTDFVEHAENAPNPSGLTPRSSRKDEGEGWTPHGWDDSLKLAHSGWYEAEAKIRAMTSEMVALNGSLAETVALQMACEGEEYDVGALLEGRPECMYLPTSEITKGRTIYRIAVPTSGNGGLNAEAFIKQGAMACAIAQAIADRGQTCEMTAYQVGVNRPPLVVRFDVPLLRAGDAIDIPFLAFAVAHPSTLRRLMFAIMEGDEMWEKMDAKPYGGYGRTHVIKLDADIIMPGVQEVSGMSIPDCAAWVKKTIEEIGL